MRDRRQGPSGEGEGLGGAAGKDAVTSLTAGWCHGRESVGSVRHSAQRRVLVWTEVEIMRKTVRI